MLISESITPQYAATNPGNYRKVVANNSYGNLVH
jgi:hypothetical protein